MLVEPKDFLLGGIARSQIPPQRVMPVDTTAEKIPSEPAPVVFEVDLVNKLRGGMGFTEVLGLNQLRVGPHGPDRLH